MRCFWPAHPTASMRNLNLAVALAEEACSLTDYNQAMPMDVLSQVYFRQGRAGFSD